MNPPEDLLKPLQQLLIPVLLRFNSNAASGADLNSFISFPSFDNCKIGLEFLSPIFLLVSSDTGRPVKFLEISSFYSCVFITPNPN